MAKRGRIMRDPTAGAGLVIVQGRQHAFGIEGVWRSDALPRPGTVVDVEFDAAGRVVAMLAVPEARLAREQAEAAIALATTKGAGLVARLGLPQLMAFALLLLAWFWLAAVGVDAQFAGQAKVTLWQAVGALNAGESLAAVRGAPMRSAGLYGIATFICLAGPLLVLIWNDRRAHLAALLPLAFMLAIAWPLFDLARPAAVSLGAGAYVALLAGLYLALASLKRFLVAAARDATVFYENE